jgi:hypothetical protein
MLFENRAAIGGFDTTGPGWYWSSSRDYILYYHAWAQRFGDGRQDYVYRLDQSALRCVRG